MSSQQHNRKLTKAQSFSVSPEEKLYVEVLAAGAGIKGGTFARHMFWRGVALWLGDRRLSGDETEDELFKAVERLIETDPKLKRLAALKRELVEAGDDRVYATPNLPAAAGEDEQTGETEKKGSNKYRR